MTQIKNSFQLIKTKDVEMQYYQLKEITVYTELVFS